METGRIIIVSTDRLFRGLVGAELIERGYEVEGVNSLVDAFNLVSGEERPPDLVLLEARGQDFDRASLLALRELLKKSVILVCAGPYDQAQVDFAGLGLKHIAVKPLTIGELVEKAASLASAPSGRS